jgi:hypothetical protein
MSQNKNYSQNQESVRAITTLDELDYSLDEEHFISTTKNKTAKKLFDET